MPGKDTSRLNVRNPGAAPKRQSAKSRTVKECTIAEACEEFESAGVNPWTRRPLKKNQKTWKRVRDVCADPNHDTTSLGEQYKDAVVRCSVDRAPKKRKTEAAVRRAAVVSDEARHSDVISSVKDEIEEYMEGAYTASNIAAQLDDERLRLYMLYKHDAPPIALADSVYKMKHYEEALDRAREDMRDASNGMKAKLHNDAHRIRLVIEHIHSGGLPGYIVYRESDEHAAVHIGPSMVHYGQCLRPYKNPIKKNALVCTYATRVTDEDSLEQRYHKKAVPFGILRFKTGKDKVVYVDPHYDDSTGGRFIRSVQNAEDSNVVVRLRDKPEDKKNPYRAEVFAIKDIHPHEELKALYKESDVYGGGRDQRLQKNDVDPTRRIRASEKGRTSARSTARLVSELVNGLMARYMDGGDMYMADMVSNMIRAYKRRGNGTYVHSSTVFLENANGDYVDGLKKILVEGSDADTEEGDKRVPTLTKPGGYEYIVAVTGVDRHYVVLQFVRESAGGGKRGQLLRQMQVKHWALHVHDSQGTVNARVEDHITKHLVQDLSDDRITVSYDADKNYHSHRMQTLAGSGNACGAYAAYMAVHLPDEKNLNPVIEGGVTDVRKSPNFRKFVRAGLTSYARAIERDQGSTGLQTALDDLATP